jgi:CheY-like chemotaxis protein
MKSFFNILKRNNKNIITSEVLDNADTKETSSIELVKQYKVDIKEIKIKNKPFRLNGLLHILTNKVAFLLQEHGHTIYYDVDNEVGRYIVGDNDYFEEVLEILVSDALLLNKNSEIILKISKFKNEYLVFDVINEKGFIKKDLYKQYVDVKHIMTSQNESVNTFAKAKIIVASMNGTIRLKSSKLSGTHYTFKMPYYEDKDNRTHQEELKKFLTGKRALFIGKDKYDTKRTQYMFETYGIYTENMKLDDFESKKPNLGKYDMAIIRSKDLSYKHISFFKTIYQDQKSNFKIIIVHELFEDEKKIALSKSIAHAELYNPSVIGDVEEILYQIFILKSKAVKGINNIETFDCNAFTIKGNYGSDECDFEEYRGANIAIVEDSKVDERILQNILTKEGITLFCMHNGSEMIDLLHNEEIDIIFTDINMPIMDGILMTKKIRSMKKWSNIPIISISSMVFPHELKMMEQAGMNASISKPIEAKDIHMALKTFLLITDKIRMRSKSKNKINYVFNKEVLDIEKGIIKSKGNLGYLDNLLKTMEYLQGTIDSFENMIYAEEFIALSEYTRSVLPMYEEIHATTMIKMFKDLNYFISQKQRTYLIDYILMYQKNWKALEEEAEKYINTI